MSSRLTPEKALIFRIVHRANLPWLLENGLSCSSSNARSPSYVNIGNEELIERRLRRVVPIPPGGTLGDYVPFYFTPFSPMLFNIHTGWGGITKRDNDDIVFLVASLPRLHQTGQAFVFSDRHAYLEHARFYDELGRLGELDWPGWRARNFKIDPENPEKIERYQAEALVHRHLDCALLNGIVCYNSEVQQEIGRSAARIGLDIPVHVRPGMYFS